MFRGQVTLEKRSVKGGARQYACLCPIRSLSSGAHAVNHSKSQMNLLAAFAALLISLSSAAAQWSIVSTTAEPLEKHTSSVSEDFWLRITLRNDSDRTLYIWGQAGFHIVEAYIKDPKSMDWERQNMGICGTAGELAWQPVKAGEEIKLLRREDVRDAGRSMMLTFQAASSPDASRIGTEILLGDFKIPSLPPQK